METQVSKEIAARSASKVEISIYELYNFTLTFAPKLRKNLKLDHLIKERFGKNKIDFGLIDQEKQWVMKAEQRSKRYTTDLKEVLQIV